MKIGQKYKQLTITKVFDKKVEVICDCGTIKIINKTILNRYTRCSKKCQERHIFSSKESKLRIRYSQYRHRITKKNKKFDITLDLFKELVLSKCVFCKKEPNPFNTIDRIDSNLGYVVGNILSCCLTCNLFKSNMNINEFISHVQKIKTKKSNTYE